MLKHLKALFRKSAPPKLPIILDAAEFERLIPTIGDFPRPEWESIQARIESDYGDQLDQAWQDFAHIWLTRLSYRLERGYRVQRSAEFILLSALNDRQAGFVLEILESMRKRILDTLGWSPQNEAKGLYTILLFADSTTYFKYIADLGPEGEEQVSVGQFLTGHYGHIALIQQEIWRLEPTRAYLLTHYILGDCHFPWWLQHGLCFHFSKVYDQGEQLPEVNKLATWLEEASGFWTHRRIKELWDGTIMGSKDKEKAEAFALLLTRAVLDKVDSVPEFLKRVDWEDAGAASVLNHTGRDLNDFVEGILGPGDWIRSTPGQSQ